MITFLLLLVLILIVVLPLLVKKDRAMVGQLRVGLVIVAMLLLTVRWVAAPPERLVGVELSGSRNWAVGWKFGQTLSDQFPDGGKLIVFVNGETREGVVAMTEAHLQGLAEGSEKGVFDVQVFRPAGNMQASFSDMPDANDMEQFVDQNQDAVAIVSFTPFPFAKFGSGTLPPVYIWDQFGSGYWKSWMKRGRVAAAAYPGDDFSQRHNAHLQRGTPEEQFGAVYTLITPATLADEAAQ